MGPEKSKTTTIKSAGLTNKKLASLVQKWNTVSEKEDELDALKQKRAEEWKSWKREDANANLEAVSGDWRLKREELMRKRELREQQKKAA